MKLKILYYSAVLLSITLSTGCATQKPYDYTALKQSKPRSIVVIPPMNNSVEADAPYVYLSTITRPLAERGYYVFPVSVIDQFMKENGLPTPAEMNQVPLDKIAENIGADAVLYVSIQEWGQNYEVLSSSTNVSVEIKLVDVATGDILWQGAGRGTRSSNNNSNDLLGALISAAVTQVVNTSIDVTPALSAEVNSNIIFNSTNGLLPGPYRETGI